MAVPVLAGSLLVAAPPDAAFANSVPNKPVIGFASRGPGSASVQFFSNGNGGVAISHFTATCTSSNGGATGSAHGTASPILVSSLTNGKAYTCRVTATNALGTSEPSNPSNPFVPIAAPGAPTAVSAVPGSGRATVTWTAPANNGGSAITGYVVTPYRAGLELQSRVFHSTATTQTVLGLTNTLSHTFAVAAINLVSSGARSAESPAILIGLPTAPTNVTAAASYTQATVKWIAPSINGGAGINGYVVTPYKAGAAQPPRTFASTALSQVITGLTTNTKYTFTVAAKNLNGTGPASAPMTPVTTGAPKVPTAPTALTVVAGNGQAVLAWTAPADNGSASINRYIVTPSVGGVARPARTYNSAAITQVVTGLTNGTSYRFTVRAGNAAGSSPITPQSLPVVVGAPTVPLAVSAASGPGKVTVSWGTPASNNGAAINGYVITPYIGTVAQPQVFTGVVNSRIITGLLHTKRYTFKVAAKNPRGTSVQSAATAVTAPNSTPVATADTYTTLEDTWIEVPAPGILANDSDADNDPLEIELVFAPGGGFELRPDGSFYYEPNVNQDGDDFFTYRLNDGITPSAPVQVRIDVIAVNDPPEAEGDSYETGFETTLDVPAPGVLANDSDPVEFDGVTASGPIAGPAHGTVVLQSNGSFTYTPDPGFIGFDGFSYRVSDSSPGGFADVQIVVHEPPCEEC